MSNPVESLEDRTHLAIGLSFSVVSGAAGRTLLALGTSGTGVITCRGLAKSVQFLAPGGVQEVARSKFDAIMIDTGGGDDRIVLRGKFAQPVTVNAGRGNDRMTNLADEVVDWHVMPTSQSAARPETGGLVIEIPGGAETRHPVYRARFRFEGSVGRDVIAFPAQRLGSDPGDAVNGGRDVDRVVFHTWLDGERKGVMVNPVRSGGYMGNRTLLATPLANVEWAIISRCDCQYKSWRRFVGRDVNWALRGPRGGPLPVRLLGLNASRAQRGRPVAARSKWRF